MPRWIFFFVLVLIGAPAPGQTSPPPQATDPAVGDVDPHATSLRRLPPGRGRYLEQGRITRDPHYSPLKSGGSSGPGGLRSTPRAQLPPRLPGTNGRVPRRYRYRGPGVRAWLRRPSYYVRTGPGRKDIDLNVAPSRDGAVMPKVPAGTVFDLIPPARPPSPDHILDRRLGRIPRPVPPHEAANQPPGIVARLDTRLDTRVDGRLNTRLDGRME